MGPDPYALTPHLVTNTPIRGVYEVVPECLCQGVIPGGAASTTLKSVTAQLSADVRKNTQIHMDLQSPDTFGTRSNTPELRPITGIQGIHIILTPEGTGFYRLPHVDSSPIGVSFNYTHSGRPKRTCRIRMISALLINSAIFKLLIIN